MCRSKVFLHTSAYEGYAVACAEALYAGAHVVSFCKPMEKGNSQEHIVETKEEAIDKTRQILCDKTRTINGCYTTLRGYYHANDEAIYGVV